MTARHPAQITRSCWDALPNGYRTGSPNQGDTRMLRLTTDLGTISVPVRIVERDELFPLGYLVTTRAALDAASATGGGLLILARFVHGHHQGNWGWLTSADQHTNDAALHHGARLISAHRDHDITWWVITEADRETTTILLPDDY